MGERAAVRTFWGLTRKADAQIRCCNAHFGRYGGRCATASASGRPLGTFWGLTRKDATQIRCCNAQIRCVAPILQRQKNDGTLPPSHTILNPGFQPDLFDKFFTGLYFLVPFFLWLNGGLAIHNFTEQGFVVCCESIIY